MRVVVLGAGTMGQGIAQVAAQAGYAATLHDADAAVRDRAIAAIYEDWQNGVHRGKVTPAQFGEWKDRLHYCAEADDAMADADLIIEAVPEDLGLKQSIFAHAAEVAPDHCVLASNTSALSLAKIAQATSCPERVLGMHFFNPVPRMQLLEIVHHADTATSAVATARRAGAAMGKTCIMVRDSPGFATSRLGVVLGNEAMRMAQEGIATIPDIDAGMRLGYGHPMGPLMLADLVGLDVHAAVSRDLAARLGRERYAPPAIIEQLVAAGDLGQKSGRGFYDWTGGKATPRSGRP